MFRKYHSAALPPEPIKMLTAILAVTLAVPDLDAALQAYERWLGYQVVASGTIPPELATAWNSPATSGRRYVLMQPASGWRTYLRLVESPPTPGYAAMRTHGWNANEILVQDPDALAAQFATGAPFRVIGPPRALESSPTVRAMQAIGPAGELNYFTRIPPAGGVFIKTPAQSFVDRTFIVVLGGPVMESMQAFYRDTLGMSVTPPFNSTVDVLQQAYGLPADTQTRLGIVRVSDSSILELDEYPAAATPRPRREGDLPPGISMVSFEVASFEGRPLPWITPPAIRTEAPYDGRRAGLLQGAAGEWIELVEAVAPAPQGVATTDR
jgi:catechol 2,3-dioxygenase-like lactoylglutathione lyase family enzyme